VDIDSKAGSSRNLLDAAAAAATAGSSEYRYRLVVESSAKSFVVFCADKSEQQSWLRDIQRCIQAFQKSVLAQKGSAAPVQTAKLIEDEEARCPLCEAPYGTVFKRKHRMWWGWWERVTGEVR
jgi:hypothetical protein